MEENKEEVKAEKPMSDTDHEKYRSKVNARLVELEEHITDETGAVVVGALDAVTQILRNLLRLHVMNSRQPPELVDNQINQTLSFIAKDCSDQFYLMHGRTLLGLPAPEGKPVEENPTEGVEGE
jgi:hypothetical protein